MNKIIPTIFKKFNSHRYQFVLRRCSTESNQGTTLDEDLAKRLETVSRVGFSKHSGFEVLKASVEFADRITHINTTKVQPLITVLENWYVIII